MKEGVLRHTRISMAIDDYVHYIHYLYNDPIRLVLVKANIKHLDAMGFLFLAEATYKEFVM